MEPSNFYLDKHLAQTSPFHMGVEVDRAEGIYIYDKNGKRYADLIAGLAVSAIGHGNQKVNTALKNQIDKYLHVMVYGEFIQEPQVQLAELLVSTLPPSLDTCYFVNSGTEANEAALKLAKRITGRRKVISFKGAYHGSTHGSLSVSGNEKKKTAFRPLLPEIEFIALNSLPDLERINEECACVILETIQADAGIRIPSLAFMQALRKRCDKVGALLILDEIQAGMGRTGAMWAFEHFNIVPDMLTLGKALGAGLPIGALISSKNNLTAFTKKPMLGHITTFGGHPLICAGARAGLSYLLEEDLLASVNEKGAFLYEALRGHPLIKEVRYKGLLFAVELENVDIVQQLVELCLDRGALLFWFLSCPTAIRLAPPLTISFKELKENAHIILHALDDLKKQSDA